MRLGLLLLGLASATLMVNISGRLIPDQGCGPHWTLDEDRKFDLDEPTLFPGGLHFETSEGNLWFLGWHEGMDGAPSTVTVHTLNVRGELELQHGPPLTVPEGTSNGDADIIIRHTMAESFVRVGNQVYPFNTNSLEWAATSPITFDEGRRYHTHAWNRFGDDGDRWTVIGSSDGYIAIIPEHRTASTGLYSNIEIQLPGMNGVEWTALSNNGFRKVAYLAGQNVTDGDLVISHWSTQPDGGEGHTARWWHGVLEPVPTGLTQDLFSNVRDVHFDVGRVDDPSDDWLFVTINHKEIWRLDANTLEVQTNKTLSLGRDTYAISTHYDPLQGLGFVTHVSHNRRPLSRRRWGFHVLDTRTLDYTSRLELDEHVGPWDAVYDYNTGDLLVAEFVFQRGTSNFHERIGFYNLNCLAGCGNDLVSLQEWIGDDIRAAICSACPVSHTSPDGTQGCVPCPAGTFSTSPQGAPDSCTPCPPGSHNLSPASTSCTPCDDPNLCPLGASHPALPWQRVNEEFSEATMAGIPGLVETWREQSQSHLAGQIGLAVVSAVAVFLLGGLLLIALTAGYSAACSGTSSGRPSLASSVLSSLDLLYATDHNTETGAPVRRSKSPLGGCCTWLWAWTCFFLIVSLALEFRHNNAIIDYGFLPGALTLGERPQVRVRVAVHNFGGPDCCGLDHKELSIQGTTTWGCNWDQAEGACLIDFLCEECGLGFRSSIDLEWPGAWASHFTYTAETKPFHEGNRNFIRAGVTAGHDGAFRGNPSAVGAISLTPITVRNTHGASNSFSQGWLVENSTTISTNVVGADNFYSEDMLSFHLEMYGGAFGHLEVNVSQRVSDWDFAVQILSVLAGVYLVCKGLMYTIQSCCGGRAGRKAMVLEDDEYTGGETEKGMSSMSSPDSTRVDASAPPQDLNGDGKDDGDDDDEVSAFEHTPSGVQ